MGCDGDATVGLLASCMAPVSHHFGNYYPDDLGHRDGQQCAGDAE